MSLHFLADAAEVYGSRIEKTGQKRGRVGGRRLVFRS
jgi:hypothetical protein